MATNMVVMVLDPDDAKRGEITIVNEPREATRIVESLLESGYQQDRIRVFSASPLEMRVVQKPVVSFVAADVSTPEPAPEPQQANGAQEQSSESVEEPAAQLSSTHEARASGGSLFKRG